MIKSYREFLAEGESLTPKTDALVGRIDASSSANQRPLHVRHEYLKAALAQHLAAPGIIKSHFKELASSASNVVESLYHHHVSKPFFYEGRWEQHKGIHDDVGYVQTYVHTMPSLLKKAAALEKKHGKHPVIDKIRQVAEAGVELNNHIQTLKGRIVTKEPKKELTPEEVNRSHYHKDFQSGSYPKVDKAVRGTVQKHYDDVLADNHRYHEGLVEQTRDLLQAHPGKSWYKIVKHAGISPQSNAEMTRYIEHGRDGPQLRKDHQEIVKTRAKHEADEFINGFIGKVHSKIGSLAHKRGGLKSVKEIHSRRTGGIIEGRWQVGHEDGTKYEVKGRLVYNRSVHGTPYVQYPMTYHNIETPNGNRMNHASEKEINELL